MARESQYADNYIDSGYTIGTYLAYQLRGKAAKYGAGYYRALCRAMTARQSAGTAFAGPSVSGTGTAYYSTPQTGVDYFMACSRRVS